MKKFFSYAFSLSLLIGTIILNAGTGYFDKVPDEVNFADYHYVGTHNSHVYKRFFNTVYQHSVDIPTQLNKGIRGFMLDTYLWDEAAMNPTDVKTNKKIGAGNVVMSHGKPGFIAFTQKGFTSPGIVEYQTFQYELENIINFLKTNPSEVAVIVLENYVGGPTLDKEISEVVTRLGYDPIFKPGDWPGATANPQNWPTLGWMRQNNKRLMITSNLQSKYVWSEWKYYFENQYGTIDVDNKLCDQRAESWDRGTNARRLSLFSHFRGDAITRAVWDVEPVHEYDRVKSDMTRCQKMGFALGNIANGYFGDRIVDAVAALKAKGKRTVFDFINELNKAATNKK